MLEVMIVDLTILQCCHFDPYQMDIMKIVQTQKLLKHKRL